MLKDIHVSRRDQTKEGKRVRFILAEDTSHVLVEPRKLIVSSVCELVDLDINNLEGRSALVGDPRRRTSWDARSSHSRHCVGCEKAHAVRRKGEIRLESYMANYKFIGLASREIIKMVEL